MNKKEREYRGKGGYFKVKAATNEKPIIFWAKERVETKKGKILFIQCKKDGSGYGSYSKKTDTETVETRIYIGFPEDIIWEKKAYMNNKYAILEVDEQ